MIVVLKKHVSSTEWQWTWNILTKKNGYSILESDTGERHAAWTPYRQKGAGTDESKKIIPALAIVLLAVVGTLLWFRPKTVILPENCRLMVDTGEESLAEGMWIEDPEQKAQLLELLSAFRIRRYLSQPATDFPPGLALKFGDFARIEVYLPDTDQLTVYYTVSLIQPSMGIFTDISTQKRWKLTGRDEIAAVAAYITQLTGQAPS